MSVTLPGPLVTTAWLADHLGAPGLVVLDARYTLPGVQPDGAALYRQAHIPGAHFFDIDAVSDPVPDLPHMLPDADGFARAVSALGIGNDTAVVVCDGPGLMSAARVWWSLKSFGHDRVALLDGGVRKWQAEGRALSDTSPADATAADFHARLRPDAVVTQEAVPVQNDRNGPLVIDARAAARFRGEVPEARPGLRAGHIPGSLNLPYTELSDAATGEVLAADRIAAVFRTAGYDPAEDPSRPLILTCGSGVTAAVLAFALHLLGRDDGVALYDGSWAEWGRAGGPRVETGHARKRPAPPALIDALRARFGERLATAPALLDQHSGGEAWHPGQRPDAVVFAESTGDVADVLRLCQRHDTPVVPFGAGTSLEGHLIPLEGGISLDLTRLDRILRVSAGDLDCTVGAGVTREALNHHLRDQGLFFPVDPGANATIGGMASTRASGTNAVRYGTMRSNVLGLTVVLADGSVIRTGGRARKSSAGYDLTGLFVGAEGTLGIITEVTLRLFGIPEAQGAALVAFDTVEQAVGAAITVVQTGIPVARMELMDQSLIRAVNARSGLGLPETDMLAFEFHGSDAGVAEQIAQVREITAAHGGKGFEEASSTEERNRLWKARHSAFYAVVSQRPGAKGWSSDVCVPVSELAGAVRNARALLEDCPVPAAILGHVGDGNFHVVFAIDPEETAEIAAVARINSAMVDHALAVGGTCTGEHGIGSGKIASLAKEHGDATRLMAAIKAAIDPSNILNPGKIFAPEPGLGA